ncbi:MAG: hypothetical protein WAV95_15810 [Azonexus sp.]
MIRVAEKREVGGKVFDVFELTLAEIRAWLADFDRAGNVLDSTLFEEFDVSDLCRLTTLTVADLDDLAPSQVREVHAIAKEFNADFFGMRQRVVGLGKMLLNATSNPLSQP